MVVKLLIISTTIKHSMSLLSLGRTTSTIDKLQKLVFSFTYLGQMPVIRMWL